jgi:hypothetical protein
VKKKLIFVELGPVLIFPRLHAGLRELGRKKESRREKEKNLFLSTETKGPVWLVLNRHWSESESR